MLSKNREVLGSDASSDGGRESHLSEFVDPPEVLGLPGEVSGGLTVAGTLDDDVLDTQFTPAAGTISVVPLVGELDLNFATEFLCHLAHLIDGGQRCPGDTGDEVSSGFEAQPGDLGPGFGYANVGKNSLPRVDRPNGTHRIHALG